MSISEFLQTLRARKVELSLEGNDLRVRGDKQALADRELVAQMRARKAELIQALQEEQAQQQIRTQGIPLGSLELLPEMLPHLNLSAAQLAQIAAGVSGGAQNVQDIYPLSPMQEGMLFHHVLENEGDVYLTPLLYRFASRARLDAWLAAMQAVIARHDLLRTAIVWEGLDEALQVVWREAPLQVEEVECALDGGEVGAQLLARYDTRHYRLDVRQAPVRKVFIAEDKANGTWMMLELMHHMMSDNTTQKVIRHEIQAFLLGEEAQLPQPLPFRDFVLQARNSVSREEHEAFFKEMLGDVDEPTAPFGITEVQGDGSRIIETWRELDPVLCQRVRQAARQAGVSVASLSHLAWALVLARTSGKDDVVFGSVLAGRMQGGEGADRVLGVFINSLPLRLQVGAESVQQGLRATHQLLTRLLHHEHAPLVLAQRCSAVRAPAPLFTAMINYRHVGSSSAFDALADEKFQRAWQGIELLAGEERTNYPFGVAVNDDGELLTLDVQVDAAIDPERICDLIASAMQALCDALEQDPQRSLHSLPLLPKNERAQLLALGCASPLPTAAADSAQDLYGLLVAQAARTPHAPALLEDGQCLSFAQTMAQANGVAQALHDVHLGSGQTVLLIAERSVEAICGLYGILAAGAAYVPMAADQPHERLAFVARDAAVKAVLAPRSLRERAQQVAQELGLPLVVVADCAPQAQRPAVQVAATDPAYVIYTSGSTGQPKGVLLEQGQVMHLVRGFMATHDFAGQRVLMIPPLVFDASVGDLFPVLAAGGSLILHADPGALDAAALRAWCIAQQVTAIDAPAALWRRWAEGLASLPPAEQNLGPVRLIMFGGEAVPMEQVRRFAALTDNQITLINHYGPTETAVCCAIMPTVDGGGLRHAELPIGHALPGVRLYVVNEGLQLLPRGVAGELLIGGPGVARGYLNLEERNQASFLPDPFVEDSAARLYRSGDLVCWNPDGSLQFLGRRDQQVKIRGYRIELGEIEAAMLKHEQVREVAVLARAGDGAEKRLVAYFVADGGAPADLRASLRAHCANLLPEYMQPVAWVAMPALPLTANGKLNRKALPVPTADDYLRRSHVPPQGEMEQRMAALWAQVLKVDQIGREDNFFELGGHSLLAVGLLSRVREQMQLEIKLKDLFAQPRLQDFCAALANRQATANLSPAAAAVPALPPLLPVSREQALPLSFAQQRMWFIAQVEGGSGAYHMPLHLHLQGALDSAAWQQAWAALVQRHESLRTCFQREQNEVWQVIVPFSAGYALQVRSLSEVQQIEAFAQEFAHAPFDLQHGPLVRACLLQDGTEQAHLLICMHHIISDGWSMGILLRELAALYAAARQGRDAVLTTLPPLRVQYADYAHWQRSPAQQDALQAARQYWQQRLQHAPTLLSLPLDYPRPAQQSHAGALIPLALEAETTRALNALAHSQGMTLYMLVLTAWSMVLARYAGQNQVVIGTPLANRQQTELEGVVGLFVNTQALLFEIGNQDSLQQVLQMARATVLDAQEHAELPFEHVVELVNPVRSFAHTPLFQVIFNWQTGAAALPSLPDAEWEVAARAADAGYAVKFDLELGLAETEDGLRGALAYSSALFARESMEVHAACLLHVLRSLSQLSLDTPCAQLPLLPAPRLLQLAHQFASCAPAYAEQAAQIDNTRFFHQLFAAHAQAHPDAPAVHAADACYSYAELNRRANQLAHYLRARGVGPESVVGLCLQRSSDIALAMLAVFKAGAAYLPLDPNYPLERLQYMLQDSQPQALLTHSVLPPALRASLQEQLGTHAFCLDLHADGGQWQDQPESDLSAQELGLQAQHLAYVIYTSGSTGKPKGVMLEQRGLSNLAQATGFCFNLDASSRVLQFASMSFDACTLEVVMAFAHGACLYFPPADTVLAGTALLDYLQTHAISHSLLPPVVLNALPPDTDLPQVPHLLVGGEAVSASLVARFGRGRQLYNAYGPTESTVVASLYACRSGQDSAPPVGQAVPNLQLYVLDGAGNPVPPGVVGEIYVGGVGVARGYLHRPELSRERFLPDPFATLKDARLYKTGDVGRFKQDGNLEFLGRNDHQVKLRGFRIELGEIEALLRAQEGVQDALVLANSADSADSAQGETRLLAYVLQKPQQVLSAAQLRAGLASRLPQFMLPAAYVVLQAWPLTPNGKLDRQALPAPGAADIAQRQFEPPQGAQEQAMAALWAQVLQVPQVGRTDNFFELGGHSLLAVGLLARVQEQFAADVTLKDLFAQPQLHAFCALLAAQPAAQGVALPPILPQPRTQALPLSFAQQRLWFLSRIEGDSAAYHVPLALQLRGTIQVAALQTALNALYARHEALRTRLLADMGDGRAGQVFDAAQQGWPLHLQNLDGADPALLRQLCMQDAITGFDLERGPLVRARLLQTGADSGLLLICLHHIISDGWSLGILVRELAAFYTAACQGQDAHLPPLRVQYADYADWQTRHQVQLEEERAYWRQRLAHAPHVISLATDFPRPAQQDHAGALLPLELDAATSAALQACAQQQGMTLYMLIFAAYALVLSRFAGQEQVVIGTPVANRHTSELEEVMGFFVNTQALLFEIAPDATLSEVLQMAKATILDAREHQALPFEHVVEVVQPQRSLSHTPLFQVLFTWQNGGDVLPALPGLEWQPYAAAGEQHVAKFELELGLRLEQACIRGAIGYATALYKKESVQGIAHALLQVLQSMVQPGGLQQVANRVPLMSAAQAQAQYAELAVCRPQARGVAAAIDSTQSFPALFAAQAARTPQALAVADVQQSLSYAELDQRSNQIARWLQAQGVGRESIVALSLVRSVDIALAILAVFKAGGAYLPLDPNYPQERLEHMLQDSQAAFLLTHAALNDGLRQSLQACAGEQTRCLQLQDPAWQAYSAAPLMEAVQPQQLAYVIYTSGSTGKPKGVMLEHAGLSNLAQAARYCYALQEDSRVLQFASLSFDAFILELIALAHGASLHFPTPGLVLVGDALLDYVQEQKISHVTLPPTVLNAMPPQVQLPACLQHLLVAGEALSTALVQRFAPGRQLYNVYGPTEITVCATHHICDAQDSGAPPLGRAIPNYLVMVLDAQGQMVPPGVVGEIHIGGKGVARGYLRREELTRERFIPDPYAKVAGARMYKSGDLGRWRGDGNLEFLGRNDHQIKLRGFRIELGEIETVLCRQPGILDALVLPHRDALGDTRLLAYALRAPGADLQAASLRTALAAALPEFMLPAAYILLDSWPLTPNGKLDRRALPLPDEDDFAREAYQEAQGELELALARIWAEMLGVARVGRDDNFFALGGHSMLVLQTVHRIRAAGLADINPADIFRNASIAALAAHIEQLSAALGQSYADSAHAARLLRAPAAGQEAGQTLFLVHDQSGLELYFHALAVELAAGTAQQQALLGRLAIYGLSSVPLTDDPLHTMEELAARMVGMIREVQADGPYRVVGWSFGGMLAYEIARQLRQQGQEVAFLALLDTPCPAHPRLVGEYARERNQALKEIYLQQAQAGILPYGKQAHAEQGREEQVFADLLTQLRQAMPLPERAELSPRAVYEFWVYSALHACAMLDYQPQTSDVDMQLFLAAELEAGRPQLGTLLGWDEILPPAQIHTCQVPGDHHSMLLKPNLPVLGAALRHALCSSLDSHFDSHLDTHLHLPAAQESIA